MRQDPKTTKTIVGMPVDPKAFRAEVPNQSGRTIHGVAVPPLRIPRAPTPEERPSVEVQVLHVEDRLSLDDRWSLEPAVPVEEKKPTEKPAEKPVAKPAAEPDSIAPAGVPRSSFARKLFVLALIGGAGAAAYVERGPILERVTPILQQK